MLSFLSFLIEKAKEASAKNAADSMGKLHELLVSKELNGGSFPEHHRDERGLRPINAHDLHASALFGKDYRGSYYNHPQYKKMVEDAKVAANDIKLHLKKNHGMGAMNRVAWTSQPSDHKLETGVDDPNSKADLIVSGDHPKKKNQQIGISLKVGKTKTPNYSNPGVSTFEDWSGANLQHHLAGHAATLAKHGNLNHEQYKELRDSSNKKHQAIAGEIKSSSDKMNTNMASDIRNALSKKPHKDLENLVRSSTMPQTHLHEIVSHTVHNADGTSSHSVHSHADHINNYLNNFENLHVKPNASGTSVTIHGTHKQTGKVMPVWRTTVYAGGRPSNKSPRGATVLPSESHKSVVLH